MCLSTGWANSSPLLCLSSSTGEEDYGVSDLRLVEKIVNLSIAAGLENPFPNYHVARPEDDTGEHFGVVQDGWQSSVNGPRERVTATEALTVHAGGLTAIDPSGSLQELLESTRERVKNRERVKAALRRTQSDRGEPRFDDPASASIDDRIGQVSVDTFGCIDTTRLQSHV